jgi:hypothetical protein
MAGLHRSDIPTAMLPALAVRPIGSVDPPGQAFTHAGAGAPCATVGDFSNPARRLSLRR